MLFVPGLFSCILLLRMFLKGTLYTSNTRLDGKTAIITGGNAGIGFETAKDLVKRGSSLKVIHCMSLALSHICIYKDSIKKI